MKPFSFDEEEDGEDEEEKQEREEDEEDELRAACDRELRRECSVLREVTESRRGTRTFERAVTQPN